MKRLHRKDLFGWSRFHEPLDIDFNSVAWVREGGNVLVDPLPLSTHDEGQLRAHGGVAWIVITNADHIRAARELAAAFGAKLAGSAAERDTLGLACERWLADGDELAPGLVTRVLHGSKTAGELALVLDDTTLITGDLVRAHRAGSLMLLLPQQRLQSASAAAASLARVLTLHPRLDAVLVGDGWSLFENGAAHLHRLIAASHDLT